MDEVKGAICALILSDKSSGSSILQAEMLKHPAVRALDKTPHQEGETLYWNKAAALLGLPQEPIAHSRVLPMDADTARSALELLCTDNVADFVVPPADRDLVFGGWRALALAHRPVFLEKSPHHLHYRSALGLIEEADDQTPDLSFRYIGLVRDPLDTLHSMWKRWRVPPEKSQHDWVRAYRNLLDLQSRVSEKMLVIRYEDLVSDLAGLQAVCRLVGLGWNEGMGADFKPESIGAARRDHRFGFRPSAEVVALAAELGYPNSDPRQSRLWPIRREIGTAARRLRVRGGGLIRRGTADRSTRV